MSSMAVRIGCGAGWARDRFGPAEDLVRRGGLDYLFIEAMSEITMSAHQVGREGDPALPGWDPYLLPRLAPLLREARDRGTRLVTNQGWLDPPGAAACLAAEARRQGLAGLKIAALAGSDLTARIAGLGCRSAETGEPIAALARRLVCAEAYLGATEIGAALRAGADVVITSRVTDASLVLGPLIAEFGWAPGDWDRLAWGVGLGHLVECGAQVTGGYFADPGYKDVPDLADVGYPILEAHPTEAVITKLPGTGGRVSRATCAEQLLYEVGDPRRYLNPDVTVDLTSFFFEEVGPDRVKVTGGKGAPAPEMLKVLVGVREGYLAEEMVLFAGPGALSRAELAGQILRARLDRAGLQAKEVRFDYVGRNAVHREATPPAAGPEPYEVVLRVAIATEAREEAEKLGREVDPLAVSGPAGTGKYATVGSRVRPVIGLHSTYVPRDAVSPTLTYVSV
jgi:hypothetical protein